ncbi:MAG: MoaD/ThiS family protein [Desulfobacterales bacterium]|nr:MoaD/ThiS family protein [Desulfobacterales bacterium]
MNINIKLYGNLKSFAPGENSQFSLTVEPGASLTSVLDLLNLPDSGYTVLVNGRRKSLSSSLQDSDTLVLFPEICGG